MVFTYRASSSLLPQFHLRSVQQIKQNLHLSSLNSLETALVSRESSRVVPELHMHVVHQIKHVADPMHHVVYIPGILSFLSIELYLQREEVT